MTTMARIDEALARFDRKSPRDAYAQTCKEMGIHMQREIYCSLPEVPQAYHRITSLDLDNCVLGTRGCMALLPIILVSPKLRKISLRTCGISDDFVKELCEILQGHNGVRSVDVSHNQLVTVYSAPPIIDLMKNNSNMIEFIVDGTHVGTNVGNIIVQLGAKNRLRVASYYQDRYFKMKDLFGYLDENGQGWVPLKSLIMNCPYPILQEQFIERVAVKKPKKRSDNSISLNTFLQMVYMNYKTETEIAQHAESPIDEPYVFMVANWRQVISAVERFNANQEKEQDSFRIALPEEEFHRLRIRDYLLTNEDADALVAGAVRLANEDGADHDGSAPLVLSPLQLVKASRTAFIPPPSMKPEYLFFQDRDADFIPDVMRNGSRLFSVGNFDMLNATQNSVGAASSRGSVVADPSDPVRTFSLPACLVKMIIEFFNKEYSKLPKKKESVVPESPRTRRDRAMEKSAIPIETLLSAEFVTDFEKICPRLLADYYARFALPIEDCTITLQEMVNVLDEMYVQTRIDTKVPLSVMTSDRMENPLQSTKYAAFLRQHLMERDEEVDIIEPMRGSISQ